jgi:transcriptional regulator with PAS, ATPase and Fis domain
MEPTHDDMNLRAAVKKTEVTLIKKALEATDSQVDAAAQLGVTRSALARRMRKYSIAKGS